MTLNGLLIPHTTHKLKGILMAPDGELYLDACQTVMATTAV